MKIDEGNDISAQSLDASIDATSDLFVGDKGKEAFDLIEPGRTGRSEMDMPARPFGQPFADQRCFMSGIVVHDEMDI